MSKINILPMDPPTVRFKDLKSGELFTAEGTNVYIKTEPLYKWNGSWNGSTKSDRYEAISLKTGLLEYFYDSCPVSRIQPATSFKYALDGYEEQYNNEETYHEE